MASSQAISIAKQLISFLVAYFVPITVTMLFLGIWISTFILAKFAHNGYFDSWFKASIPYVGGQGNLDPINYVAMMGALANLMSTLGGFCFAAIILFLGQRNHPEGMIATRQEVIEETTLIFGAAFVSNFIGAYVSATGTSEKSTDSNRAAIEFICTSYFMLLSISLMLVGLLFLVKLYNFNMIYKMLKGIQIGCSIIMILEFSGSLDDATTNWFGLPLSLQYLYAACALICAFSHAISELLRYGHANLRNESWDTSHRIKRHIKAYNLYLSLSFGLGFMIYILLASTESNGRPQDALSPYIAICILLPVSMLIGGACMFDFNIISSNRNKLVSRYEI